MPAALRASTPDIVPGTKLVRLRTFNPRRGNVRQTLSLNWNGVFYRFEVGRGWYRVPDALAEYLETVPTRESALPGGAGEEDLPSAFHVCGSLAEAQVLDRDERRRQIQRARPKDAIVVVNDVASRALMRNTAPEPIVPPDGMTAEEVLEQLHDDEDAEAEEEEQIEAVEPVAPIAAAAPSPARVHRETMAQVSSADLTDRTAERAPRASGTSSTGGWGKAEALVGRTPIVEPGSDEQNAAADVAAQRRDNRNARR